MQGKVTGQSVPFNKPHYVTTNHLEMRVAFASCSHTPGQIQQPVWGIIQHQLPDLLLLLGDNVYIGPEGYDPPANNTEEKLEKQRDIRITKYKALSGECHFAQLIANVDMLAIWDNHDLGLPGPAYPANIPKYGADASEDFKKMARRLFDKYLKSRSIIPDSKDVYCSKIINGIKFIMLDVRSYQENPDKQPPHPPAHITLLGKDQEEWLIHELLPDDAEIKVICSGIAYSEGNANWLAYPAWNKIFMEKVARTKKLLFLGGNIHTNEFKTHPDIDSRNGKYFYEIISSGVGRNIKTDKKENMNKISEKQADAGDEVEENRKGPAANNYGLIDFTPTEVIISLYGQRHRNLHYAIIDRKNWTLTEYRKMVDVIKK